MSDCGQGFRYESLVNVAFALLLLSLATAAMVVGAYRRTRIAPQPQPG